MTNFNEQTGELRVNDVLTTTFNEQTGEIKLTNSTSSQTETLYTEEQVREAIKMARREIGYGSNYEFKEDIIIQSLKQSKKD